MFRKTFSLLFLLGTVWAGSFYTFAVKNTDIKLVAEQLARLTGKNVVIDPRVRGKISIFVRESLNATELWNIFSQALNQYGYTLRFDRSTQTVQIVPLSMAKNLPYVPQGNFTGEYRLALFELKNVSPKEVANRIKPILSLKGRADPLGEKLLAVWDFAGNLKLVEEVLPRLDRKDLKNTLRVYRLEYTTARNFKRALGTLVAAWRAEGKPSVFYSDIPNENAVMVVAPLEFQRRVEKLVEDLGELGKKSSPDFYVIKLRFTSVDEIKKALDKLFAELKKGNSYQFPNGVRVSFDKSSNAVLVYGTESEYKTLKEFISKLDRRRKQVLITATIVEASAKDIFDKGVNWQVLGTHGGAAFGALSREGLYQALSQGNFVIGALSTGGTTVNVGGTNLFFPDLLFLYSLLEQGSGFNIISNPKVLTLDNQKATIKVGQQVPFPTGIKYDTNGNPIITYNYKYVGLQLDVTPRISTKSLRLVIDLKLQEITGYLNNNVGGINYSVPITSTRELNSDVVVQNGQTIIIGGLIGNKKLFTTSKVPLLGDIPLLGNLFSYKHTESEKTNLFIFITPYVISSPEDLEKIMELHRRLAAELVKLKKEKKKVSEEDYRRWLESLNAAKPLPVR